MKRGNKGKWPHIDDKLRSSVEKIEECLCQKSETIYYASEVTKLHEHGGKQTRLLVITDGGVYVMLKPSKRKTVSKITKLERVVYTKQENTLFLKFSDDQRTFTCKSPHALDIGKCLLWLHRAITLKVDQWKRQVRVESNPEGELVYPDFQNREPGSLQMRIMALANEMEDVTIEPETLKKFEEWDRKPHMEFRLGPDEKLTTDGAASVIARALALDSELRKLSLAGFCPKSLKVVLEDITSNAQFLVSLGFDGYKMTQVPGNLRLRACERTRLEDLSFQGCSGEFVLSIMQGLKDFEGVIKTLTITKCKLAKEKWAELCGLLQKTTCFVSLRRINFEDDTIDDIDLSTFSSYLEASKIVALSIGNTEVDGGDIFNTIGATKSLLRQLYFRRGSKLFKPVPESLTLCESIMYISLDKAQFKPNALKALLQAILTKPRTRLLTIDMKNMGSARDSDIVKCFDFPGIQPILAELVFASNALTTDNMPAFIQFLKTQKYIMHLDVSNCFKKDVDKCLAMLAEYVIDSKLRGLELNSDAGAPLKESLVTFINSLTGKAHLQTLSVKGSASGDAGLKALCKFVQDNPKMSSLACDGCAPKTPSVFIAAYNEFLKLDMLEKPREDSAAMKDSATLPEDMESKPPPKTWMKRLSEYENFDVNSSALMQPMDALMGVMSLMVNAIKNPDTENNIFDQNVVLDIRDSLATSSVNFGARPHINDPILQMLGSNSRTAEEVMTEYQTMHDF